MTAPNILKLPEDARSTQATCEGQRGQSLVVHDPTASNDFGMSQSVTVHPLRIYKDFIDKCWSHEWAHGQLINGLKIYQLIRDDDHVKNHVPERVLTIRICPFIQE